MGTIFERQAAGRSLKGDSNPLDFPSVQGPGESIPETGTQMQCCGIEWQKPPIFDLSLSSFLAPPFFSWLS
jgi:hypothetical protein